MSAIRLSTEFWPVVVTTLNGTVTDNELAQYFAEFHHKVLERHRKFASLVDAHDLKEPPSAAQRKMIAEWEKAELEVGTRFNVGVAMVLTSPLVRGALTALHWLLPPPTPTVSVGSRSEALNWCLEKLDEAWVPVPARVRDLSQRTRPAWLPAS